MLPRVGIDGNEAEMIERGIFVPSSSTETELIKLGKAIEENTVLETIAINSDHGLNDNANAANNLIQGLQLNHSIRRAFLGNFNCSTGIRNPGLMRDILQSLNAHGLAEVGISWCSLQYPEVFQALILSGRL